MAFSVEMRLPGDPFPEVDALAIQWGAEGAFVWAERDGRATVAQVSGPQWLSIAGRAVIERDPVRFWQGISLVLLIAFLVSMATR